ncbi:heme ABC transporter ATP-binding protein [Halopseudomonas phragmitis]|uniref:Heme ABC transporter ATP-binding protein n=2 Tax=Pseudomonadaceae TaxID=135621 RepID=A0A1V0B0X1_9GAMM|nr:MULTISPECIES: heme ABC transporter ATP-binding protein [Pseudomonadaceae]AQZ93586.1 heme ABC transporter ATP-binding protein [Halopseudomonas phragmitis]RHW20243.1 heme ABC transporter ATP-binding protein [Pseudomonas jilinensis]
MLKASQLACARGGCRILEGIDFTLAAGEVVAVLGTNGAGKSTLMATLTGELPIAAGRVELAGRPLADWPASKRAQALAVLPQSSTLAFPFSAEEVVAMGRLPHHSGLERDRQIIEQAMQAADVAHLRGRNYLTLSGGERQRVHLARVLAQIWETEGACLLLDEPTASLDLAHQQLTLAQARGVAERGGAVLVILHDLNLAARFADRILLLDRGRMLALGSPWEVLEAERIRTVFGVEVLVQPHPQQNCPLLII